MSEAKLRVTFAVKDDTSAATAPNRIAAFKEAHVTAAGKKSHFQLIYNLHFWPGLRPAS